MQFLVNLCCNPIVLTCWEVSSSIPCHFLIGNHEVYNFSRRQLVDGIQTSAGALKCSDAKGSTYYTFCPSEGFRVIVLDTFDFSVHSRGRGQGLEPHAVNFCSERNHNVQRYIAANPEAMQHGELQFAYHAGLEDAGLGKRFAPYNGGLSTTQLNWLSQTLEHAAAKNEKCILLCHNVIHPAISIKTDHKTLLWNYEEVLQVINSTKNVVMVVSGHQHEGGYCEDQGVHHLALESPLLCPSTPAVPQAGSPGSAYIVEVHDKEIIITGQGAQGPTSPILPSPHGEIAQKILKIHFA